jgi:hypothetical protein
MVWSYLADLTMSKSSTRGLPSLLYTSQYTYFGTSYRDLVALPITSQGYEFCGTHSRLIDEL